LQSFCCWCLVFVVFVGCCTWQWLTFDIFCAFL
jgi:hypothetical protein